jgi:hypothetical protein
MTHVPAAAARSTRSVAALEEAILQIQVSIFTAFLQRHLHFLPHFYALKNMLPPSI